MPRLDFEGFQIVPPTAVLDFLFSTLFWLILFPPIALLVLGFMGQIFGLGNNRNKPRKRRISETETPKDTER
jgi:hypothetical protein